MNLTLKKTWIWLKNYWYWPLIAIMIIVFSMSKSSLKSKMWDLMAKQKENYKKEIDLIQNTQEDLSSKKEEIVVEHEKKLVDLEKKHEEKVEEIKQEKRKEVTVLIEEYKEDPDELAKRVAAALSAEYSKTQWENKK